MAIVDRYNFLGLVSFILLGYWTCPTECKVLRQSFDAVNETYSLEPRVGTSTGTKVETESVPEYLGAAWMKDYGVGDLSWAGMAIGMGSNLALIHADTYRDIDKGGRVQNEKGFLNKVVIPGKLIMDTADDGFKPQSQNWELVKEKVGGKEFSLVKILDNNGFPPKKAFARPNIESNINNLGKDCRAYGWAIQPIEKQLPPAARLFSSLKVDRVHCEERGECRLNVEEAQGDICPSAGDRGVPILCGPEKTLTFLVDNDYQKGCITKGIKAIHMAALINDIDKHSSGKDSVYQGRYDYKAKQSGKSRYSPIDADHNQRKIGKSRYTANFDRQYRKSEKSSFSRQDDYY